MQGLSRVATRLGVLMGILLGVAEVASADGPKDQPCPTFFPDFFCERQGRYDGFVAPMTAPFLFEDPFITSNLSVWSVWQQFPERSVFQGGDVRALAVQARVAVTDRLAFIATKDGYISLQPDQDLLDTEEGYGDLALGFKYALIDRRSENLIITPSFRVELAQGSPDVFSGNGEGVLIPGISFGWGLGDTHFLGATGWRRPIDGDAEVESIYYNFHVDHRVSERFVPFVSLNGVRYVSDGEGMGSVRLGSGARLPLSTVQAVLDTGPFEGGDILNLGSNDVAGTGVMSLAIGARVPLTEHTTLGIAYERPISDRKDLMKQRLGMNLLLEM